MTYRYSLGGSALHVGPVDEINSGGLYELFPADLVSPSGVCLQTRTVDSEENVEDLYLSLPTPQFATTHEVPNNKYQYATNNKSPPL